MGMEIPQGDINTNLITYTITSILTHTQHHKYDLEINMIWRIIKGALPVSTPRPVSSAYHMPYTLEMNTGVSPSPVSSASCGGGKNSFKQAKSILEM